MSDMKTLKDVMEEWDQKEVVRYITEHKIYTQVDADMDRLAEKVNFLAELVDQKIDLILKEIKDK
jgi:hypothetical protein